MYFYIISKGLCSYPCLLTFLYFLIVLCKVAFKILSYYFLFDNSVVKIKVKLSLDLTKHHAMKMYWGMEV